MKQVYTEVPGTLGAPPRQAAMRLLRYATALAGDPTAPKSMRQHAQSCRRTGLP